ncbi:hypothetical protein [Devosia sp. DBB001]|nr:hypothetical protein [Devosia sp. DBB001]
MVRAVNPVIATGPRHTEPPVSAFAKIHLAMGEAKSLRSPPAHDMLGTRPHGEEQLPRRIEHPGDFEDQVLPGAGRLSSCRHPDFPSEAR